MLSAKSSSDSFINSQIVTRWVFAGESSLKRETTTKFLIFSFRQLIVCQSDSQLFEKTSSSDNPSLNILKSLKGEEEIQEINYPISFQLNDLNRVDDCDLIFLVSTYVQRNMYISLPAIRHLTSKVSRNIITVFLSFYFFHAAFTIMHSVTQKKCE